jgi:PHD/YefM family antitoxin component YafN of YafNO toxin-antitoxin module
MAGNVISSPLTQRQLIEEFFMEHRTKVLDIAAFMDRLDRAAVRDAEDDFRYVAFRETLRELSSAAPGRVERVQMILSDQTTEPLETLDRKAAYGASIRTPHDNGQEAPR